MFRFCWNSFQSFHRLRGNCETKKNMEIVSWELQSRRLDVFWCCCLASSSVNGEVKRKLEDTPTHLAIQKKVTWNELHYFGTFGTWWFHDFIVFFISFHRFVCLPSHANFHVFLAPGERNLYLGQKPKIRMWGKKTPVGHVSNPSILFAWPRSQTCNTFIHPLHSW